MAANDNAAREYVTGQFDGIFLNVPHGFVRSFEQLGWQEQLHVYADTHHYANGTMLRWCGDGEPTYPRGWKSLATNEDRVAAAAVVTEIDSELFITLGPGDGSFQRWRLTEEIASKLEYELASVRMRR